MASTSRSVFGPTVILALFLAACAPGGAERQAQTQPNGPAAPKRLVMAVQSEPDTVVIYGRPSGTTTPNYERYWAFHGSLTMFDYGSNPVAYAAQKVPAVSDGDWRLNPDGGMEVTWKIRPDVLWHDGAPLTADDFVFGFEVSMDPRLAVPALGEMTKIASVRAIDATTFVAVWKQLSIFANQNQEGVPAIPRHLLEEAYRSGDPAAFEASPAWRGEFVGIGPFRVTRWEAGSHIEAEAFDRFFLGRPKIDQLLIRFVADVNVMVANLLAGVVDLAPAGSMIKPEQMVELRRQWGPEGGQVFSSPNAIRTLYLNFREPGPWTQDVRVRQAMAHALNKEQLVEALHSGFTEATPYFLFPEDPLYRLAEQRGVPKYPYDPNRALQLLAEAGWARGPDGLVRNSVGQTIHFSCCRYPDADSNDIRESLAWVSDLRAAGIDAQHPKPPVPAGLSPTDTRRAQQFGWGGESQNFRVTPRENLANFTAAELPRDETRWTGTNRSGFSHPTYEDLFARMMSELDPGPRQELQLQLTRFIAEQVPAVPVYYNPIGVAFHSRVRGVVKSPVLNLGSAWNIYTWDLR